MKTLLAILLTLTLLAAGLIVTAPIAADCDPATDPTCKQQCPRDGECVCYSCTPEETAKAYPTPSKPTRTPHAQSNPAVLLDRVRTINFARLLEGAP